MNPTGWWFGTCFIFPYIGNNSRQLTFILFRGVETTNQPRKHIEVEWSWWLSYHGLRSMPLSSTDELRWKLMVVICHDLLEERSGRYSSQFITAQLIPALSTISWLTNSARCLYPRTNPYSYCSPNLVDLDSKTTANAKLAARNIVLAQACTKLQSHPNHPATQRLQTVIHHHY